MDSQPATQHQKRCAASCNGVIRDNYAGNRASLHHLVQHIQDSLDHFVYLCPEECLQTITVQQQISYLLHSWL